MASSIRLFVSAIIVIQFPLGAFHQAVYASEPQTPAIVTEFTYYPDGKIASMTDPGGKVTNFVYDENQNLTSITDGAKDRVTSFGYDQTGYLNAVTNANGSTRQYIYDDSGKVFKSIDARGNSSSYLLDKASRIVKVTDPENNSISFNYDNNNNITEITTSSGRTRLQYDSNNRLQKITDEKGAAANFTYDPAGHLTAYQDRNQFTSNYEYDKNGLLTKSLDPSGHATTYQYDSSGRLIEILDPFQHGIHFSYDANGNLITRKDAEENTVKYQYDQLDRLVQSQTQEGETTSLAYDPSGNLIEVANSDSTLTFKYDRIHQLISSSDNNGRQISYTFDKTGNLTSAVYPHSNDFISRLKAFLGLVNRVSYEFDPDNHLTSITAGGLSNLSYAFQYDRAGRLVFSGPPPSNNRPAGVTTQYTYGKSSSSIAEITLSSPNGELEKYSYQYDAFGNVIQALDSEGATTYEYDAGNRLINVRMPDGTLQKYTYDADGNMKRSAAGSTSINYSYNRADELTGSDDGNSYTYDNNGNLLTKKMGDQTTTYTWNSSHQLKRIDFPDGTSSSYQYDGLGRRISKIDRQGRITRYVYDGEYLVQELDDRNRIIANYTPGFAIDHPFSVFTNNSNYYYMYDRLGSVVGLVDEEGNQVARYRYDPWGNPVNVTEAFTNPVRFAGGLWDEESGLYYFRSRYYDPQVGRFISRDPFQKFNKKVPGYNQYVYVQDNPTNFIDPYGTQAIPWYFGKGIIQLDHESQTHDPSGQIDPLYYDYILNAGPQYREDVLKGYQKDTDPYKPTSSTLNTDTATDYFKAVPVVGPSLARIPGLTEVTAKTLLSLPETISSEDKLPELAAMYASTSISALSMPAGAAIATSMGPWAGGSAALFLDQVAAPMAGSIYRENTKRQLEILNSALKNLTDQDQKVGGISLNKSAELLVNINEINGAVYDPASQQLILIGKSNSSLPPMSMDDLAVAIRSIYGGTDPAISIDPGPTDQEMVVRYFGQTEDTEFGRIMFESDRLLKTLSMGQDNLTQKEMRPNLPGFKTEIDLATENITPKRQESVWHRLWFYPKEMVVSQAEGGMVFDRASLEVKSEYLPPYQDLGSDPAALAFAAQLTTHYDDLAKEYPDLEKLRQLAKIVSIVKWLKDNQIPIDMAGFEQYQIQKVPTAKKTPTQTVWGKEIQSGMWLMKVGLFGGVDFSFENTYNADQKLVAPLKQAAVKNRPEGKASWSFNVQGETYTAVAVPLGEILQPGSIRFNQAVPAGIFSSMNGMNISLAPSYDSFKYSQPTEFGYGWKMSPFDLEFPHSESVFPTSESSLKYKILLNDHASGRTYEYQLGQDLNGALIYIPDDSNAPTLNLNSDGSISTAGRDGGTLQFDQKGRLLKIAKGDSGQIDFNYSNDKLTGVKSNFNQSLSITYNQQGRIRQVQDALGRRTHYEYDDGGNLAKITDARGNSVAYAYDHDHHLIQTTDGAGQIIFEAGYDEFGRIIKLTDANQQEYSYAYDSANHEVVISNSYGNQRVLEYGEANQLEKVTDPDGKVESFQYGAWKLPLSIVDRMGNRTDLDYDVQGNIVRITSYLGIPAQGNAPEESSSQSNIPVVLTPDSASAPTSTTAAETLPATETNGFDLIPNISVATFDTDKHVLAMGSRILVVNAIGEVWVHDVSGKSIKDAYYLAGPLVASNSIDKYVLVMDDRILVVNSSGETWTHEVTQDRVGDASLLRGAVVATNESDKYVLADKDRILVVNSAGDLWAHDVTASNIGDPYYISGSTVAADPTDRYVFTAGSRILVVNSNGDIWAHDLTHDSVSSPYLLTSLPMPAENLKAIVSINNKILVVSKIGEVWISNFTP